MIKLNFRLRDGLPLGFDYSGTSWDNLTWLERKRHNFIINFRRLKEGRIFDFLNYSGWFNKYTFSYYGIEKFEGVNFHLDRVYWKNHKVWVKFKFVFGIDLPNKQHFFIHRG